MPAFFSKISNKLKDLKRIVKSSNISNFSNAGFHERKIWKMKAV